MILIAGGTGDLGTELVGRLTTGGHDVRVLTRDPGKLATQNGVEFLRGNVRDVASIDLAMCGVDTVISAVHGFTGRGDDSPKSVDLQGNENLIAAARKHGVGHFVLISVHGASPDHRMELFRMKFLAEEALKRSGMPWTIIRPTAYMETWSKVVGEPLLQHGRTRIFGRGRNPINFVSVRDVAAVTLRAIADPTMRGQTIDVGGPESLSMRQVVDTFAHVAGKEGTVSSVPLPMMRVMSILMRPLNPMLARQIQAGVVMDTTDQTFNGDAFSRRFPSIKPTRFDDLIQRNYGKLD